MKQIGSQISNVMVICLFVSIILLFSGCLERKVIEEEPLLPSIQAKEIASIKQDQMDFFEENLNPLTGLLLNYSQPESFNDYILTGQVLNRYKEHNTSYQPIIDQTIQNLIETYEEEKNNLTVSTKADFLIFLSDFDQTDAFKQVSSEIIDEILFYQQENYLFNTTPLLSSDTATLLHAIVSYDQLVENQTISHIVQQSMQSYQNLINETLNDYENTEVHSAYTLHYFTDAFKSYYQKNTSQNESYDLIISLINPLINDQKTSEEQTLGLFSSFSTRDPHSFHLGSLLRVMSVYSLSQERQDQDHQQGLKQSVILGLIYIKNNIAKNTEGIIQTKDHLNLMLCLHQAQQVLPSSNYTFLWDANNQLLLEGRELETSPTLWMLLTIGVMGSIGLLALVYVVIQLYYKNKQYK